MTELCKGHEEAAPKVPDILGLEGTHIVRMTPR